MRHFASGCCEHLHDDVEAANALHDINSQKGADASHVCKCISQLLQTVSKWACAFDGLHNKPPAKTPACTSHHNAILSGALHLAKSWFYA